jgi:Peptidase family M23
VSTDKTHNGQTAYEPVYAMGAGIAHYGVSGNVGCGPGVPHSRGNWLWIDHGDGVISWYGHLAWPFTVPNGSYVTPKSKIGYIGNSGYSGCRTHPALHYIDLAVKYGGQNDINSGYAVQMYHLYACRNGVRQIYPQAFNPRHTTWNSVPAWIKYRGPEIPGSDKSCEPTPPRTPTKTSTTTLTRAGSGILQASWTRPSGGYYRSATVVLIREYHPSIRRWLDLRKHVVSPTATSTKFTGLHLKHAFRVRVYFANAVGVSAYSPWAVAIAR